MSRRVFLTLVIERRPMFHQFQDLQKIDAREGMVVPGFWESVIEHLSLARAERVASTAFDRFKGEKQGTMWYYRALVNEFRKHGDSNSELIDELDRVVAEIERLANQDVQ
jgi:hypothetical protein